MAISFENAMHEVQKLYAEEHATTLKRLRNDLDWAIPRAIKDRKNTVTMIIECVPNDEDIIATIEAEYAEWSLKLCRYEFAKKQENSQSKGWYGAEFKIPDGI